MIKVQNGTDTMHNYAVFNKAKPLQQHCETTVNCYSKAAMQWLCTKALESRITKIITWWIVQVLWKEENTHHQSGLAFVSL